MIPGLSNNPILGFARPVAAFCIRGKGLGLALLLAGALAACGGATASNTGTSQLQVVTTSVLLADMARNVAGDVATVRSIVPAGADLHSFQSTPEDSIAISRADLIISHGAGLDDSLFPVIRGAQNSNAVHVKVGEGLDAPKVATTLLGDTHEEAEGGEAGHEDHQDGEGDPHFWQDPRLAMVYVARLRDGLTQAAPDSADIFQKNTEAYIQDLKALDEEIEAILEQVPPERRHLVTFHNAFGHFGRRYGWQVSSLVSGDASEATPTDVTAVLDALGKEKIPAVFVEPQFPAGIVHQAAQDAGIAVGTIYSDTLDGQVNSYVDMMRFNANSLAQHLK